MAKLFNVISLSVFGVAIATFFKNDTFSNFWVSLGAVLISILLCVITQYIEIKIEDKKTRKPKRFGKERNRKRKVPRTNKIPHKRYRG